MEEEGELFGTNVAFGNEAADSVGSTGGDDDGLKRNPLQGFHGFIKGHPGAKKRADFAGSAAEDGNIEVAGAEGKLLRLSAAESEKAGHFANSLAKERRLGIVMLEFPAFAPVGHPDGERDAKG